MKIHIIIYSTVVSLLCITMLGGCAKNDENTPTGITQTPKEKLTKDQLSVTSNLKTYIFPGAYAEVPMAIVKRVNNRVLKLDSSVKMVIINAVSIADLTAAQYDTLFKVFADSGNLVIAMPSVSQWNDFAYGLSQAAERMTADHTLPTTFSDVAQATIQSIDRGLCGDNTTLYVSDGGEKHPNEHYCDLIALRNNDVYCLDDLMDPDRTEQKYTVTRTEEDGSVSEDSGVEALPRDYTDYDYGQCADHIVTWLNEQGTAEQSSALLQRGRSILATRANSNLEEIMSAQTQKFEFPCYTAGLFKSVGWAVVVMDVWGVNDLSSHSDYYLVQQRMMILNSRLNCGPDEEKYWFEEDGYGHTWQCYGGYLSCAQSDNRLEGNNAEQVAVRQRMPQTAQGSTSYLSGVDWNIGGDLGLSKTGPQGGLSGGVTFSNSKTTTTPDLNVTLNGTTPSWRYDGAQPKAHNSLHYKHDNAASILRSDCELQNTWIWQQPAASGVYTLVSNVNVQTQILAYRTKGGWWSGGTYFTVDNWHECRMILNVPSRSRQSWRMSFSADPSTGISDYLKDNYAAYWNPSLVIYAADDKDTSAVEAYWSKFHSVLDADKQVWKNNGFKGDITFNLKREGATAVYATFTLAL